MKTLKILLVCSLLSLGIMAQEPQENAARQGLELFKKLILVQPSKEKQFTAADTAAMTLGKPLPTSVIVLDKLKGYKATQSPESVLQEINEQVYPVMAGDNKRLAGSVTITKANDNWKASRFGADNVAVEGALPFMSQPNRNYRLVKLQAFRLNFLSYSENGNLYFISLQDDAGNGIQKGATMPASAVLEKYAPMAANYNGLPM